MPRSGSTRSGSANSAWTANFNSTSRESVITSAVLRPQQGEGRQLALVVHRERAVVLAGEIEGVGVGGAVLPVPGPVAVEAPGGDPGREREVEHRGELVLQLGAVDPDQRLD